MVANNYEYINNNYSIIVRVPRSDRPKLIIMTHADHPGVILKNNKEGLIMGSPGIERLKNILSKKSLGLRIFSPTGKYLGKGRAISLEGKNGRLIRIKSHLSIPRNSFATYDVEYFQENDQDIKVYNADNAVTQAILLTLLKEKHSSEFDLYIIFNLHEEVHQVSSWYHAKNNILDIRDSDFILNLECLKIENVDPKKYGSANYEDGVVLQLSNTGCLFGYKSKKENLTEKLIRYASSTSNIGIQTGVIKDSCDSRPFSYFNLTPNIATLTIPNRYKHNRGEAGNIVAEQVYKKDINNCYEIIKTILKINPAKLTKMSNIENVSYKIRQADGVTDHQLMAHKAMLNERLDTYYKNVIKRGYFYAEKPFDLFIDYYSKILLYIIYLIQKVSKFSNIR